MSKYKFLRLYGLRELLTLNSGMYSPSGNVMIVINSGVLGGQLFYDRKANKIYGLCLKEVPFSDNDTKWIDGEYAQEQVRHYMNYQEAIDFLKSKGKWDNIGDK